MRLFVRRVTFAFWVEMGLRLLAIALLVVCLWELVNYDPDFHGKVVAPFYAMITTMLTVNTVLYVRAATLQIVRYRLGELPEDPCWGRNVETVLVLYGDIMMVIISTLGPLVWAVHLATFQPISQEKAFKCRTYPHVCAILDYYDMPTLHEITHLFYGVAGILAPCLVLDFCHFLWAVKIRRCRPRTNPTPLLAEFF